MSTQVGTPPVNHNSNESINGRNPTIPAVPSPASNGSSFDHKRTPSMTVTPAGATGPNANGTPQNKSTIQFGSVNVGNSGASPAVGSPATLAHQPSASLGVNSLNPRMPSPSNSPSPIPQPSQVSGGRPPPGVQGPGSGMSFGQFGGDNPDVNGMNRQMSQMHLGQEHMRRGSSQSIHSDIGGPGGMPNTPGRGGYPNQGGRGRGFSNNYGNQMSYSPQHTFRPQHQNGRGSFQGRGGPQMQFQGSPSMQHRTPMMNPGTPQMNPMTMVPGGQQYAYGPYQGYGSIPITADPSISYNSQQYFYQGQYPNPYGGPPQSPRPFQQPGYGAHMQSSYSNQGQAPAPMSRQSSQISTTDRPSSGIGQTPQTPASVPHHASARTPSMSGADIQRPQKRSAAIVIKNAAGEVVDFKKQAQQSQQQQQPQQQLQQQPPAPAASPAPTPAPPTAVPTPPLRTPSAADTTHVRTDSQSIKNDEEKKKAMQEAVARKIKEEKEQEEEKLRKQKEAEDEKAQMEEEAVRAAELQAREAAAKKEETERLEREAEAAKEVARKAQEEQARTVEAAAKEQSKPATDEIDFDALAAEMEAEEAAREAEEARREEEYMKKKAAQKEAQLKKDKEEAAAYEANMKEMERRAEEEELAREKKKTEGSSDDEARKMFAALKVGESDTPAGDESPAATPGESGTATPVSDVSMGPPAKGMGPGRRGKAEELKLDTKKSVEPPEPSATLKSLTSARMLDDPLKVSYPSGIVSPNPALNTSAPADRKFKYNKEFLLQFQDVLKEKPSLDWDQKIRDALGDGDSARAQTARTPSGMGGRSGSNRPPAGNAFTGMGNFGGRAALPAGSTSEQRFAASQALRGGPVGSPFAFGRPPNMGPPMGRTPSNNPLGPIPGSPRVGGASRGGSRAESKRAKQSAKHEAEHNKSMPLTAGMQIGALEVSSGGWKARSIGQPVATQAVGLDGYMEADVVQRKVKAALNKMTPEKFDRISDQILEIAAQSKHESDGRTLRQVIQLVFEKATDEAHWAPMYAQFCFKMLSSMSNDIKDEGIKDKNGNVVAGGNLFRKYLLNRCQEEFERGWKVNLPQRAEGESEEAIMLSDEYYTAAAAKRRGLGLVRFIGELFKLGMLTERIMHECVKKLLDYEGIPDEAEVESLSSLLRTIGRQLDDPDSKAVGRMDAYFDRIKATIGLPDLNSRLKFMLMDIVDLRRAGWVSKDSDKGPKTITQIHEEAEAKRRDEEMAKLASQAGGRGGGPNRIPLGRGDARSFSGFGQVPPPDNSNRVGAEDLRRLGGRSQRQSTTPSASFGPSGLGARTNSGRRGLGPALSKPDESNVSSRTGTPPAQKEKDKKDESSTNAFSALAALDGHDAPASPPSNPSSPPTQKSQPIERQRSRSPEKKE